MPSAGPPPPGYANFPQPLPDELLYSLFARAAVHLAHWSPKGLLELIYRHRGFVAVPDLPTGLSVLEALCESLWCTKVADLIGGHTLVPYYTHFRDEAGRAAVLDFMLNRRSHLHLRLGICSGGVRRTAYFRLCPSCTREDCQNYGETYWRRSHHLPGVVVCGVHFEPLLETSVPFRPLGVHEHVNATRARLRGAISLVTDGKVMDAAAAIAQRSARLLAPLQKTGPINYRPLLLCRGFVGRRGGSTRFREAFLGSVPLMLLPIMFRRLDNAGLPTWFDAVRREPRRAWHPLKHICLQMVLDGVTKFDTPARPVGRFSRRDLSKTPELRSQAALLAAGGQSTRAIAAKMGVAWETANRMLDPRVAETKPTPNSVSATDRKHWSSLISKYPNATRTQLRRRGPALYARLYRGDRRWLTEQACASPVELRKPLVDWLARDTGLAAEVSVKADEIRTREPAIRVTRSRILRELQRVALVAHQSGKLPKTLAVLAGQCETLDAFRVRRLTRVLLRRGTSPVISRTSLLRAARINTSRLADGGVALINAARQGVVK